MANYRFKERPPDYKSRRDVQAQKKKEAEAVPEKPGKPEPGHRHEVYEWMDSEEYGIELD